MSTTPTRGDMIKVDNHVYKVYGVLGDHAVVIGVDGEFRKLSRERWSEIEPSSYEEYTKEELRVKELVWKLTRN